MKRLQLIDFLSINTWLPRPLHALLELLGLVKSGLDFLDGFRLFLWVASILEGGLDDLLVAVFRLGQVSDFRRVHLDCTPQAHLIYLAVGYR